MQEETDRTKRNLICEPLHRVLEHEIEEMIITEELLSGERVPSTNQIAKTRGVNPATALRALNDLVARGILTKRRGLGMLVAEGARDRLKFDRRQNFESNHIDPLLREAQLIGLSESTLIDLVRKRY